jgi:hypothetical protein
MPVNLLSPRILTVFLLLLLPVASSQGFNIDEALEKLTPETGQNIDDLLALTDPEILPNGEKLDALFGRLGLAFERTANFDSNCLLNDVDLLDQGQPHAIGKSTGVISSFRTNMGIVASDAMRAPLQDAATNMATSVGIIILDNFARSEDGNIDFAILPSLLEVGAFSPGSEEMVIAAALSHVSHGALVLEHFKRLIESTEQFDTDTVDEEPEQQIITFTNKAQNSNRLVLLATHYGTTSQETADALSLAIHTLESAGINNIAVNMSFALNPCKLLEPYRDFAVRFRDDETRRFESYEAYLFMLGLAITASIPEVLEPHDADQVFETLASLVDSGTRISEPVLEDSSLTFVSELNEDLSAALRELSNEIIAVLTNPVSVSGAESCTGIFLRNPIVDTPATREGFTVSDPLLNFLCNDILSNNFRSLVASAGNFGRPFQMFPAALNEVVGVTASLGSTPGKDSFFNDGEILELGGFYDFSGVSDTDKNRVLVAGTSYSASIVTLFTALDMAQTTPTCTYGNPPGLAKDAFSTLSLNNRLLSKAVMNDNCKIP